MVFRVERLEGEPGQIGQRQAKGPRRFLTQPMQEPSVGLGDDRQGRMAASRRTREQLDGSGMESIRPNVGNGSAAGVNCPSTATLTCSATGTWWLDLDAAEVAHPGMFYGKPLNIVLGGFTNLNHSIAVAAVMNARLEKK